MGKCQKNSAPGTQTRTPSSSITANPPNADRLWKRNGLVGSQNNLIETIAEDLIEMIRADGMTGEEEDETKGTGANLIGVQTDIETSISGGTIHMDIILTDLDIDNVIIKNSLI
ncbi:uncharacterized protein LOC132198993 [Neocloeon triangulifer]|uniref:uncharacterized protein LOC132198993 n=1 Tax=Neocloeon triangulifer TaxID=2078957 RepID=UPI00286F618E|nr:uncharacterized protein LOC132198993 [Neocloeon triangulifer]